MGIRELTRNMIVYSFFNNVLAHQNQLWGLLQTVARRRHDCQTNADQISISCITIGDGLLGCLWPCQRVERSQLKLQVIPVPD